MSLRVVLKKQVWRGLGLSFPHLKSKSATNLSTSELYSLSRFAGLGNGENKRQREHARKSDKGT